jgi:hypothetical protein
MTRATYDIYDLNSPAFVEPTAPATTATTTRRSSDRLMRGSVYLLIMAGAMFLAAFLVTAFLSRTNVDLTVPFVAMTLGGLAFVAYVAVTL